METIKRSVIARVGAGEWRGGIGGAPKFYRAEETLCMML